MSRETSNALLYLTLMLCLTTTTFAQTPARANTCCGLLSGKVYCYGGLVYTSATENKADNIMNVLDITNQSGTTSEELQNLWQIDDFIKNNLDLTPRTDPQCAIMDDGYHMVINGGKTTGTTALKDINIMFNQHQNKWYAHSAYSESPYGWRQIYGGSASFVPGKGAAFYGGFEDVINPNWTLPYVKNASIFTLPDGRSRSIGFTQVNYFNIYGPTSAWDRTLPLTTEADQFSAKHQSIFDPVTNMLLFMGGEYRTPTSDTPTPRPFSYTKTFNTATNEWGMMTLTGDIPSAGRIYSTLTLLPSTNRHVLLYGGEINDEVVKDYCNVLNLDTKVWTRQWITAPDGVNIQRSRHSSVLVNNNTLFVMWGIDPSKQGMSSVLIFNTTNPDAITMSDKYIDPNVSKETAGTPGDSASTGLSSGAKAGIVVGVVAAVILGALGIWFYLRNKKKNQRLRDQELELQRQQQQAEYYNNPTDVEPMEVNWDQIEAKYTEMPATTLTNNKSEQLGAGRESATSTTLINGGETVHPDAVEIHRPNVMDSTPQPPKIMKPDGGY